MKHHTSTHLYKVMGLCTLLILLLCTLIFASDVKTYDSQNQKVIVSDSVSGLPKYETWLLENTYDCFDCRTVYNLCNPTEEVLSTDDLHLRLYEDNKDYLGYSSSTFIEVAYQEEYQRDIKSICTGETLVWDKDNISQSLLGYEYECVVGTETIKEDKVKWQISDLSSLGGLNPHDCVKVMVMGNLGHNEAIDNRVFFLGVEIDEFVVWNNTWIYWRDLVIDNPHSQNLTEYVCNLTMDTATLIGEGKLSSNGSDFRVVNENNVSIEWSNFSSFDSSDVSIGFRCNLSERSNTTYQIAYGTATPVNPTNGNRSSIWGLRKDSNTVLLSHLDVLSGTNDQVRGVAPSTQVFTWNTTCKFSDQCVFLNGTNEKIDWADDNSLDLTGSWTLEAWVYPMNQTDDASYAMFGKRKTGTNDRCNYLLKFDDGDNDMGINYQAGAVWVDYSVNPSPVLQEKTWYHIAGVYDEDNTDCLLYLDGELINLKTDCTNQPTVNTAVVTIGSWQGSVDWNGIVDEVRISDRVRTPNEINHSARRYLITLDLGVEETAPTVTGDLLFSNVTNIYKSLFDEGEDFYTYLNLTNDGVAVNDSNCSFSFVDGLVEQEFINENFSICGSGCDYVNTLFNVTSLSITNAIQDELRFEVCDYSPSADSVRLNSSCNGTGFDIFVNGTNVPDCSNGVTPFVYNITSCVGIENVTIEISNSDVLGRRFQVLDLEYDRAYSVDVSEATFNYTTGFYELTHTHEYYIHGNKTIFSECVNPDDSLNNTRVESITIVNTPPIVVHTSIEVIGVGNFSFEDNVVINKLNNSIITFNTITIDDDFANASHIIECAEDGVLLNDTSLLEIQSYNQIGSNFSENNCNLTTTAYDLPGLSTTQITPFSLIEVFLPPVVTQLNITPSIPIVGDSLNCSATALDSAFVNLTFYFYWTQDGTLRELYNSTIESFNNTQTHVDTLVPANNVGDVWACFVEVENEGIKSNSSQTSVEVVSPDTSVHFPDITSTGGALLLGVLIIVWLALIALGSMTGNIAFLGGGYLFGIVLGFVFLQVHAIITIIFVVSNVVGFVLMFMGN